MSVRSTTVAWIGPLPPPVHGASLVTARLLDRVREQVADVRVVDVAGSGSGLRHDASRVRAHLRALAVVVGLPAGAVVYVSLSGGLGLWYQLPVLAAARLRGLRIVVHHHSYAYLTARAPAMVLVTRLLGRRDRHLFLSAIMRTAFLRRYSSRADHQVVSNAHVVEPGSVRTARPPADDLVLVHVSNLGVSKGSVAAVAACEALRRRDPRATLTLVGPCGDDETAAAIESAGDAVRWLGPRPTEGVYEALDAADVFLFPSNYVNEAEPLVVLEALSRGVPVIATRRGALPELLPPEWLVESPDPDEIAARVEALCSGGTWRADAAARARALFAARCADSDPVALVLEASAPEPALGPTGTAVLQVLPTFDDAFGGPVSAALGVSESYAGVDGISLCTVGAGRPGAAWDPYRTVARRAWSSPVGPRHTLSLSIPLLWWLLRHLGAFDLVHVHFHRGLTTVWVPLLARLHGVPYVLQTHGTCTPWRGPLALVDRLFTRPAVRHARAVCVLNTAERDQMLAAVPGAAVVVVHNAVRTPGAAPATPEDRPGGPRLLFCARLHPRKGLACFLDVVEQLAVDRPGLEAHVVGPDEGALAAARARVTRGALPVTFHGGLERQEVDAWMTACDVLLHPAPEEPFGMSMLEAFAAGLPVVAAATSELAALFAAEGAALLPPDDDVEAWAEAVGRVLDEPALRESLRMGGRAVLERHFSRASLTRVLTELVSR